VKLQLITFAKWPFFRIRIQTRNGPRLQFIKCFICDRNFLVEDGEIPREEMLRSHRHEASFCEASGTFISVQES